MTLLFFYLFFCSMLREAAPCIEWFSHCGMVRREANIDHQAFQAFLLQATLRRADQSIKDLGSTIDIDRRSSINSSRPETGQCLVFFLSVQGIDLDKTEREQQEQNTEMQ